MFIRKLQMTSGVIVAAAVAAAVVALLGGCESGADEGAVWQEPATAPTVPASAEVCAELDTIMRDALKAVVASALTGTRDPDPKLVKTSFTAAATKLTDLAAGTADPATKGAIQALADAYGEAMKTADPMAYMDRRAGTLEKPINDACGRYWTKK